MSENCITVTSVEQFESLRAYLVMRTTLKAVANIGATGGLALWTLTWIAWIPGTRAAAYVIDTAAWHGVRAAVAWLRLTLGASIGPEDDELIFVQCYALIGLAWALGIVCGENLSLRLARLWMQAYPTRPWAPTTLESEIKSLLESIRRRKIFWAEAVRTPIVSLTRITEERRTGVRSFR